MSLRELLAKPFGPYTDSDILSEKCKSTNQGGVLELRSLWMDCKGELIGLDESNAHSTSNARTATHPIRFYGVLEIKSLSWLSDRGRKWLEIDLQKRDIEKGMHSKINPVSKLRLAAIYGEMEGGLLVGDIFGKGKGKDGLRLKVWIKGEKNMTAAFLTSSLLPDGLLLTSKDCNRRYEVLTMDVDIYEKSRNFLCLYQLLKLMHTIVDTDPHALPLEKRTINYFVTQYLERFSFTDYHRFHRDIYHEEADSDVDEHGNTTKPRHPRHVARSDIIGIFASQAEWILADQLAKRESKRVVDIDAWKEFCQLVRQERKDAERHNVRWGLGYGKDVDSDDSDSEIDWGKYAILGTDVPKLRLAAKRKKTKTKITQQILRESPQPNEQEQEEEEQLSTTHGYSYDSDFSQSSTPSWSDSSSVSIELPDPEIFALVPRCLWHPPDLPDSSFLWRCPVHACKYTIDMLQLTDENVKCLDQEDARFLREKRWQWVTEERVLARFYDMVSSHWDDHLTLNGIKLVNEHTKRCTVEWIHPKRHRPWLRKPLLCRTCTSDTHFVRMSRHKSSRFCSKCNYNFTIFRWNLDVDMPPETTAICGSCAKANNICQVCLLRRDRQVKPERMGMETDMHG